MIDNQIVMELDNIFKAEALINDLRVFTDIQAKIIQNEKTLDHVDLSLTFKDSDSASRVIYSTKQMIAKSETGKKFILRLKLLIKDELSQLMVAITDDILEL